jgi:hypothetical protein
MVGKTIEPRPRTGEAVAMKDVAAGVENTGNHNVLMHIESDITQ